MSLILVLGPILGIAPEEAISGFSNPATITVIYGPGGYKFLDFIRVGVPLNLLLAIVTPLYICLVWGL